MKVYLSEAKKLKSQFPFFREWESAMKQKFGNDITSKTNEIWNLMLQKEDDKIKSEEFLKDAKTYKIRFNDYNKWQAVLIHKYGEDVKKYLVNIWKEINSVDTNESSVDIINDSAYVYISDEDLSIRKILFYAKIFASVLLFISLLKLPMGYYTFLKIVVCGISCFAVYKYYLEDDGISFKTIIFGIIALIFNPIIPIYLGKKQIWSVIDISTAVIFLVSIIFLKELPFRMKKEKPSVQKSNSK